MTRRHSIFRTISSGLLGGLQRAWRALTRPRQLRLPHRLRRLRGARPVHARRSQRGVAILVVITTLMVLTVVVTEMAYGARVRFMVAAHQTDRTRAYWLARSGVNLYRMMLMGSIQMGNQINGMLPAEFQDMVPENLWQMMPVVNTGLIRMLLGGGIDSAEDVDSTDLMSLSEDMDEEVREESREASLFADQNFLDFEGDFSVEVKDHESRINVNAFANEQAVNAIESPTGQQLFALMSGEENDQWFYDRNIDRWEIIGNLKDWVDQDSFRSGGQGGQEDSLYNNLDQPYMTKNAPFDTVQEIQVVEGWQGAVFDKFGEYLTVFGSSQGKINVQTADPAVVETLVRACPGTSGSITDSQLQQCRENISQNMLFGFYPENAREFAQTYLQYCGIELDQQCLNQRIGTESQTFTVTSTGLVGNSAVNITAVISFDGNPAGKLLHWRVD